MTTTDQSEKLVPAPLAEASRPNRRQVFRLLARLGVGSAVFQRALAAQAQQAATVTADMIRQAEWIAGLDLADDQRQAILQDFGNALRDFKALRNVPLPYDVPP